MIFLKENIITSKDKTVVWVNIAKLLAILAVIIDHCYGNIYYNRSVQKITFFSMSVFVFVQGFTSFLSYKSSKEKYTYKTINRIKSILLHYTIASLLVYIIRYGCIDHNFFVELVNFKVESPYYYVFLYIQLCLCTIPLIKLLDKNISAFKCITYVIVIVVISFFSTSNKLFGSVLAGGGYLFGGTFLIVLFCGILFGCCYSKVESIVEEYPCRLLLYSFCEMLLVVLFMFFDRFHIDGLIFGDVFYNPPNITIILYSISLSFFVYILIANLNNVKAHVINKIISILNYFGKHTLYVFLYHYLLIDVISNYCSSINKTYKALLILPIIMAILLLCLLIEKIINNVISSFNKMISKSSN